MHLLDTINQKGSIPFTFVKLTVKTRGMELEYGWVLKISSFMELINYQMCNSQMAEAFLDHSRCVKASSEYKRQPTKNDPSETWTMRPHYENVMAHTVAVTADLKDKSFIKAMCDLSEEIFKGQMTSLEREGTIYIQHTGSYMSWPPETDIWEEETWERSHMVFPDSDEIKILQWPQGTHWYAKIGNVDVVIDGEEKWDTYDEADVAAKRFVDERITS